MLLLPFYFTRAQSAAPQWQSLALGSACYLTGLLIQITFILPSRRARIWLYQAGTITLLAALTVLFISRGFAVEGCIFGLTALMQLILVSPIKNQFSEADPMHLIFVFSGFGGAVCLTLPGAAYDGAGTEFTRNLLTGLFFAGTSFEVIRKRFFPETQKILLSRVQAIPWLTWCLAHAPTLSAAHLTAPAILAATILFNELFPWERLRLPSHDILGGRTVKIGATLESALLIFLSALLLAMDYNFTEKTAALASIRGGAFLFFSIVLFVLRFEVVTITMALNGLMEEPSREESEEAESNPSLALWNQRLARYLQPFLRRREEIQIRLSAQDDQINMLLRQINQEKKRSAQITHLMELSQQLENPLDQPVAAQLTVNSLERALNCDLVCLFTHDPDQKEFMLLAAAGKQINLLPSGFRQNVSLGSLGRAMRQRKTQVIRDTRADADYIRFEGTNYLSAVVIPLIYNGHINGAITLDSEALDAFSGTDIWLAETAAAELTRAWERSRYQQRLTNLVQTGSQLSAMVQPEAAVKEVAVIAREILQARFTFVQVQLGQERNFTQIASSGEAPRLLESLRDKEKSSNLVEMAFNAVQPFRVRDVRKYSPSSHLAIDHARLRSMLAIPIRWHRLSIGAIFAFGKQNEVFFNENDQSLAELLSMQAGGAFESAWLQQELRSSLRTTSLLYRLSNQIIMTDNFQNAAEDIAQTAHKIAKSMNTGIMLFNSQRQLAAEAQVNAAGVQTGLEHPKGIIEDVLESGQVIYLSQGNGQMRAFLPIQTPILKYGVLWLDLQDGEHQTSRSASDLQALASQTAIALERSALLAESQRQAAEIKAAYKTLEATYDQTLAALISALDARDRETEGHSLRVSQLTAKLGKALNLSDEQLKALERGSLLHDIGKIGISDRILHKPGPLSEEEWTIMRRHPDIGARIVEGIPFLEDTIPLIRHHQERWDGSGYPDGLRGEEIPLLARVFSVVDAFDALTSDRPYRKRSSEREALAYLREQAGILFDPRIVELFERLVIESGILPPPDVDS